MEWAPPMMRRWPIRRLHFATFAHDTFLHTKHNRILYSMSLYIHSIAMHTHQCGSHISHTLIAVTDADFGWMMQPFISVMLINENRKEKWHPITVKTLGGFQSSRLVCTLNVRPILSLLETATKGTSKKKETTTCEPIANYRHVFASYRSNDKCTLVQYRM